MPLGLGDVVRVSVRHALSAEQDHVNVYYYECTLPMSGSDAEIVSDIENEMSTAYSLLTTHLTNTATPVDVKVDEVAFVGGVEKVIRNVGTVPFTPTSPPAAAGEPLPPGVAALVKFLTGIGKTYGRKFIGMFAEGAQSDGVLVAGVLTALEAFAAVLLSTISGTTSGTLQPGVMSKPNAAFVPFTVYDVASQMAYQRRRRPGTGS